MSFNRSEQMIFDYVQSHADERQYWQDKVRSIARNTPSDHVASIELDVELWHYFAERSRVVNPFKATVQKEGLKRISMRNLAEHWLRIWAPLRPKKKSPDDSSSS
jgi:hypothetical protein